VIEKKAPSSATVGKGQLGVKQRKQGKPHASTAKSAATKTEDAEGREDADAKHDEAGVNKKRKKSGQKGDKSREDSGATTTSSQPPPSSTALTPLQSAMRQKLVSARFRHLNETLYTSPSTQALELFNENPTMFQEYHEGFRRQVEVWPQNPVDEYVEEIKQRGKVRRGSQHAPTPADGNNDGRGSGLEPLPRTAGTCHIADLGCGDAKLAHALEKVKRKFKVEIFSFDLHSPSPLVTKADIAHLPLQDGSMDVAVFCLALMGTNWIDFIEEAYRVLRWKGELWISEIKSRFGRPSKKDRRVEHSVGNRKKSVKGQASKGGNADEDADVLAGLDGNEQRKDETDVSDFVTVLQRRGFVLHSERAVDLSNKMFVRMKFIKCQSPTAGKLAGPRNDAGEAGGDVRRKTPKPKFLDKPEPTWDEASVLKPCVYKIR
jgi:ribosomal RNA-processing protein 8